MKPALIAQLLDIRSIIGGLFGIYGIILILVDIFDTNPEDLAKAQGTHINLWTGVGMLVVAAIFLIWVVVKPGQRKD